MAWAIGWDERCSTAAARLTIEAAVAPLSGRTSTTSGAPRVRVPVLSNATQRTVLARSRYIPPLISTPLRAADASAATIDTGVEITSAQGHDTTSSTSARYSHSCQAAPRTSGGRIATAAASAITIGV